MSWHCTVRVWSQVKCGVIPSEDCIMTYRVVPSTGWGLLLCRRWPPPLAPPSKAMVESKEAVQGQQPLKKSKSIRAMRMDNGPSTESIKLIHGKLDRIEKLMSIFQSPDFVAILSSVNSSSETENDSYSTTYHSKNSNFHYKEDADLPPGDKLEVVLDSSYTDNEKIIYL